MTEKDFFTQKRNEFINNNPRLLEVEQWGKYCYTPLDIPRFDHPELIDWFFHKCKPTTKLLPDIATNTGNTEPSFDAIDVIPTGNTDQSDIWTLNIQQDFLTDFPDIYNKIMEVFPFKILYRIRLWASTQNVLFHRDHTKFLDYPGAFRIMLHDTNPRSTLSLIDTLPDTENNFSGLFNIPRLEETNCFTWNNLRTKHGSFFNPKYRKIVIILDRYDIDVDRYNDLMIRSVAKYGSYAMTSNNSLSDYVNL